MQSNVVPNLALQAGDAVARPPRPAAANSSRPPKPTGNTADSAPKPPRKSSTDAEGDGKEKTRDNKKVDKAHGKKGSGRKQQV